MDLTDYIKESSELSINALAQKMKFPTSTLARQLKGERTLTLETLRDISLATGLDFLDLAVRAELITEKHAEEIRGKGALSLATNEALLDELQRRMEGGTDFDKYPPVFDSSDPLPQIAPLRRKKKEATREEQARAALAEELEKDDNDLAAYRHRDGDELDYDSYY